MKSFEWQPIETAPKDGTAILAVWVKSGTPEELSEEPRILRRVWFDGLHTYSEPTHWMPLPDRPERDKP